MRPTGAGARTASARQLDTLGWRARAYVNMDARTQTAWGTVQTVFSIALRSRSGIFNGSPQNGPGGQNTASPQVYAAYIRFAGFTFGRAPQVFSSGPGYLFYWTNFDGGSAIGTMQLAYTATFGGGFSATIALTTRTKKATCVARTLAAGWHFIGVAARIRTACRTWFSPCVLIRAGASFGLPVLLAATTCGSHSANTIYNKTGWAVGADAKINLPSLGRGDALWLSAAYPTA